MIYFLTFLIQGMHIVFGTCTHIYCYCCFVRRSFLWPRGVLIITIMDLYLFVSHCYWKRAKIELKRKQFVVRRLWQRFMWRGWLESSYMDPVLISRLIFGPLLWSHYTQVHPFPLNFQVTLSSSWRCILHHPNCNVLVYINVSFNSLVLIGCNIIYF